MSAVSPVIDSSQFRQYITWLNSKSNEEDERKPHYLLWQSLCMPQAIHFVCRHVEILATDELPPFWKSARETYACGLAWTWRLSRVALGRECCLGRTYLLMDTKLIFAPRWKTLSFEAEADRMLQSVHLVGEDENDLYSGFNEYNPAFDTEVRSDVRRWHATIFCAHRWWFSWKQHISSDIKAYVVFSLY